MESSAPRRWWEPLEWMRQLWETVLSEKRRVYKHRSGEHWHFRKQAIKGCLWRRKNSQGQRNRIRGRGVVVLEDVMKKPSRKPTYREAS